MQNYRFVATCLFGIESEVAFELRNIGARDVKSENGRVIFSGDATIMAKANMNCACAERILLLLSEFEAHTFEDLFQGVKAIPWGDIIGRDDEFPVKGYALKSDLHSVPDCQAIIKKAAVESMSKKYGLKWFEESGTKYQIQFSILNNKVSIMLDTSGAGLHKRGYRQISNIAPIKETLAAGIVRLARVNKNSVLYDPFCGSGTIVIEGIYKALKIAPGIRRRFACEKWDMVKGGIFQNCREQALSEVDKESKFMAYGSDIDMESMKISVDNLKKAGVISKATVEQCDIADFVPKTDSGIVICNPPYGERMLDREECAKIYKNMGLIAKEHPELRWYVITPDEDFEQHFDRKADKKRKLYNGMIKCNLYQYFK